MRKQIAAANWKMNCDLHQAKALLKELSTDAVKLNANQEVILAVPFPYLLIAKDYFRDLPGYFISAQNCYTKENGAYTGETSATMIASCGATHVIIGHSERRGYFKETSEILTEKIGQALAHGLTPIFCCGESLQIREAGTQNAFVARQIRESLFNLAPKQFSKLILAYEPIWAIGTGKTATAGQAQEMHVLIRKEIEAKFGSHLAAEVTVLYGGSVKSDNAAEIFSQTDVDGGLVGGASLKPEAFKKIISSLK